MKLIDLTGQRFGRLVVLARGANVIVCGCSRVTWLCLCDCGKEKPVFGAHLRNGDAKSCACGLLGFTHGKSRTPEYLAWQSLNYRCNNPNNASFPDYGGRGISVCERWSDFPNFLSDMGTRPSPLHSLDRIDNDGNYEPSNCRWATAQEQQRNKRISKNNTSGVAGVVWNKRSGKWTAHLKVFLGSFHDKAEAIRAREAAERDYGFRSADTRSAATAARNAKLNDGGCSADN
jgi:hypothetical protein